MRPVIVQMSKKKVPYTVHYDPRLKKQVTAGQHSVPNPVLLPGHSFLLATT